MIEIDLPQNQEQNNCEKCKILETEIRRLKKIETAAYLLAEHLTGYEFLNWLGWYQVYLAQLKDSLKETYQEEE